MKSTITKLAILASVISCLFGFRPDNKMQETSTVILRFNNLFGKDSLSFDKEYINAHGEKMKFFTFNYFISNIRLTKKDGTEYIVPQDSSYFMLRQSEGASHLITLNNIPAGKYTGVTFTIGVDSARSTMDIGHRGGALDVAAGAKGMYWVWNSGYIFLKLEGKSPSIPDSVKNTFRYHIGGYGGYDTKSINNIKIKTLDFKKVVVSAKKQPIIDINVDVASFFNNKTPLKVAEHPVVMSGVWSSKISENYVSIFNLGGVSYQKSK